MRIRLQLGRLVCLSALGLKALGVCATALADDEKLFAAPASTQNAVSSGAGSMAQATLALALVLAAVFAAAWGLRRLRKFGGNGGAGIEVISQAALGAKERAILLKVAGAHVLVGVAPGRVNVLHVLGADSVVSISTERTATASADAPVAPTMPSFKALLKQSLGLR